MGFDHPILECLLSGRIAHKIPIRPYNGSGRAVFHLLSSVLQGVYQTPADVAEDVADHAIKNGYRHVDSATVYRNEEPSAKVQSARRRTYLSLD